MLSNCDLVSNVSPLLIFCRYQMKCKSVSNVSPRYNLDDGRWLPSAGVGYRFEFKPRVNVRLDYGVGKGSSGFYFQVGEAF
ncbi:hypothetical protein SFF50_003939 [Salmonella enterica]|nr:hypothetical protein [Salmonella enterica]